MPKVWTSEEDAETRVTLTPAGYDSDGKPMFQMNAEGTMSVGDMKSFIMWFARAIDEADHE
jgi:hypothetical protein